jgi:hypothetical protein
MFLSWMVSRFHILTVSYFYPEYNKICYCCLQGFELCHISKRFVGYLYVMGLSYSVLFLFGPVCFCCLNQWPCSLGTSKITHARYLVSAFNPNIFGCQCKHCDLPSLFAESSWSGLGFFRHPYWRNCPNLGSVTKCLRTRWSKQGLAVATVRSFFQNASKRNSFAFLTSNSTESLH